MSAHETTPEEPLDVILGRRHEVLGIVAAAATLLMSLSLLSYDARGGENLIGPVGTALASMLASAFGVAAWLLPIESGLASIRLFTGRSALLGVATVASTLVIVLVGCALTHLALGDTQVFGGHLPGGVIGEVLGEVLRSLLGLTGVGAIEVTDGLAAGDTAIPQTEKALPGDRVRAAAPRGGEKGMEVPSFISR